MSRVPLVLSVVAVAALGCATSTSSSLELPDLSAASLSVAGGSADSNDWIRVCPAQLTVRAQIDAMIAALEGP